MADNPIPLKPQASQATRDRDLVVRTIRDELVAFVRRKFAAERKKDLAKLGPDVNAALEALAEAMALLHVDAIRSIADGDRDVYQRKLAMAKAREEG
jgi:hypothetical protein